MLWLIWIFCLHIEHVSLVLMLYLGIVGRNVSLRLGVLCVFIAFILVQIHICCVGWAPSCALGGRLILWFWCLSVSVSLFNNALDQLFVLFCLTSQSTLIHIDNVLLSFHNVFDHCFQVLFHLLNFKMSRLMQIDLLILQLQDLLLMLRYELGGLCSPILTQFHQFVFLVLIDCA